MASPIFEAVKDAAGLVQDLVMLRALRPPSGEALHEEEPVAPKAPRAEEPKQFIRVLLEALPADQITVAGELRLSEMGDTPVELRKGGTCEAGTVRSVMVALECLGLIEALSLSPRSTFSELARHVQGEAPLSPEAKRMLERYGLGEFEHRPGWSKPGAPMALPIPRTQSRFRLSEGVAATVRSGVVLVDDERAVLVNPERHELGDAYKEMSAQVEARLEQIKKKLPLNRLLEVEEAPLLSATGTVPIILKNGERYSADHVRDTMLRPELLLGADVAVFGALYGHVSHQESLGEIDGQLLHRFGLGASFQSATPDASGNRWGIELAPLVRAVVLSGIVPVRDELWLTNLEKR